LEQTTELTTWKKKKKGNKNGVRVSQPISNQMGTSSYAVNQTASNSILPTYTDGTSLSQLPQQMAPEQSPNFDNMYRRDTTPLIGAATPGMAESFEPMAANDALGGGAFGSW
jgi:hypothetical protein